MTADEPTPLILARLRAIHEALDNAGFEHAVGGAIALAIHAEPRFTADIDLNVIADPNNPEPLLTCLPDDITIHEEAPAELQRDGQTRLIWADPETPIDIFLPQHPRYHQLVNDRAVPAPDYLGIDIKVISATDLMVFKMMFDRPKDWVDIEGLLEANAGDAEEAGRWIAEFLGEGDPRLESLRVVRDRTQAGAAPSPPWPRRDDN